MEGKPNTFWGYIVYIIVPILVSCGTTLLIKWREKNKDENLKIQSSFQNLSSEIIEILLPLLNLSLYTPVQISLNYEDKMREISRAYYKYYNTLPDEVLLSLNCLYLCLKYNASRLYYIIREGSNRFIDYCTTNQELLNIIDMTSISDYMYQHQKIRKEFENEGDKWIVYFTKQRPDFIINCQTRYVVSIINKYYGTNNLKSWRDALTKQTVAKRHRKHGRVLSPLFRNTYAGDSDSAYLFSQKWEGRHTRN